MLKCKFVNAIKQSIDYGNFVIAFLLDFIGKIGLFPAVSFVSGVLLLPCDSFRSVLSIYGTKLMSGIILHPTRIPRQRVKLLSVRLLHSTGGLSGCHTFPDNISDSRRLSRLRSIYGCQDTI